MYSRSSRGMASHVLCACPRCVAGPLGGWLNVRDKSYSCPSRQAVLEKAYAECPRPGQEMVT